MFSYYGSKSKIVDYYPPPKYGKIIEPFAGSARYSLKYWNRDILLVDKYEIIINVWRYLQDASEKDILSLPSVIKGQNIRTMNLSEEERILIGFCIGRGNMMPMNVMGSFSDWELDKKRIAADLYKIKHWKIIQGSYSEIPNEPATWFIDPPYQYGGHKYRFSNKLIDFKQLRLFCENRMGQAIVCENTKANWMPFKPMIDMTGAQEKTTEAIWSNHVTNYDNIQLKLL